MSDYAKATGAPRAVTLDGADYLVGKWGPRDIGDLQAWLKEQVPNPKEQARRWMEGVPESVALKMWEEACREARDWPPTLTSGHALLTTTFEGQARILHVSLRRHNPGFDLNRARDLAERIDLDELNRVVKLAQPEGADPAPKGSAAAEETTETETGAETPPNPPTR